MFHLFQNLLKKLQIKNYANCVFRNDDELSFDYDFVMSLDEKQYPKYLRYIYQIKTGEKLNLRHPKTINEKIQWLKIYDNLPIKTQLTDKVLVRDWVKDRIGVEYLKPILAICNDYNEIDFDNLPDSFIIKCNHGCKWHVVVKNKSSFLQNKKLLALTKLYMDKWLSQTYFGWSDFETQYKNIVPKILIEPLLRKNVLLAERESGIHIFCFNSQPKIFHSFEFSEQENKRVFSTYDHNFKNIEIFSLTQEKKPDEYIKKAVELSKILCKGFKFVRIDWFIFNDKLYFEEMTFTPCSGYIDIKDQNLQLKLGNMLNLKGNDSEL